MSKRAAENIPAWAEPVFALKFPFDEPADNAEDANATALRWRERGFVAQAVGVPTHVKGIGEIAVWVCRVVGLEPQ